MSQGKVRAYNQGLHLKVCDQHLHEIPSPHSRQLPGEIQGHQVVHALGLNEGLTFFPGGDVFHLRPANKHGAGLVAKDNGTGLEIVDLGGILETSEQVLMTPVDAIESANGYRRAFGGADAF